MEQLQLERFASFTYLRMGERLFHPENWMQFVRFAQRIRGSAGGAKADSAANN
jgi:hypothetical protein